MKHIHKFNPSAHCPRRAPHGARGLKRDQMNARLDRVGVAPPTGRVD